MAFQIEILTVEPKLYQHIEKASQSLNNVQQEFIFRIPTFRLMNEATVLKKQTYYSPDIFKWLKDYRVRAKGARPYLIMVVDGPLYSSKLGNLFGSHEAIDGVATFTIFSFDQFVNDIVRYCRYFLVRYSLSFLAPHIRVHPKEEGCYFDEKIDKTDITASLTTGRLCDKCRDLMKDYLNPEIVESIKKMSQVVSNQIPRTLIIKGGGVKGLAFAGALLELEKHYSFDEFVGTSAGAIAALLLAAGYTPTELLKHLRDKDFRQFKDASFLQAMLNLIFHCGLYPGLEFENWFRELISKKCAKVGITRLVDLPVRAIVYATQKGSGTLVFDSSNSRKETEVTFAARCSMSIPLFFIPPLVDNKRVYDGGVLHNFPLQKYLSDNPGKPFIGIYIDEPIKRKEFIIKEILGIVVEGDEREIVDKYREHIVVIDTQPIKATDFSINMDDKEYLISTGRMAAIEFLKKSGIDNPPDEDEIAMGKRTMLQLRDFAKRRRR